MLNQIKHWLEPPYFPGNEEKTAQARTMNAMGLYFVSALAIAAVVYVPFFAKHKIESWAVILALFAFYLIARTLMFRGQLKLAGLFMISSGWIACEGLVFISGGISSPMMFALTAITIAIGLLFHRRVGSVFLALNILFGLGFAALQQNRIFLPQFFVYSPLGIWFYFTLSLTFINWTINLTVGNLEKALAREHQHNMARQRAEATLRGSEERFSTTFHASQVAQIITVLESGLILDANRAFSDLMGYTRDELIGHTSNELNLWMDFKDRGKIVERISLVGNMRDMEMQLVTRARQLRTVLVSFARIELKGEKCMISTLLDITERKRAETHSHIITEVQDALLRPCKLEDICRLVSEKVKQLIGDGITATSMLAENQKTIHVAAYHGMDVPMEKVLSIFGFDPLQLNVSLDDMTEEELKLYRSGRLEILEEGLYALMTRLVPKPACLIVERLLRVHKIYVMGFAHKNEHLGGLIIFAHSDITPHIAAIEQIANIATIAMERKRAEKALRQAEAKYRDIFESATEGIFQSTPDGRFLSANTALARIFGYETLEKMIASIGNNIAAHIYVKPDRRAELVRMLDQQGVAKGFEADCYRKDGSIIQTRTNARAIRDANDNILYYEGFLEDITERKRAEKKLEETNKHLEEQLMEIKILRDYLQEQATRDPLTNLYNRRYLYETIERELARAKRENCSVSVMMIDIDHFKDFNDKYGHQAGDKILVALGDLLRNSTRQGDIACRYGGEEFIIIMPGASETDAGRRAETIRRDFNNLHINHDGIDLSAAISIGLAFYPQHGNNMDQIIKAADSALYEAKQAGRNRVHVWKNR